MPELNTRADSLRWLHSGAASEGAAQTDPLACLGGFIASTEVTHVSWSVASPISNVTIDYVAGANGIGDGTLTAASAGTLTWAAPGGSAGAAVSIANGETKTLEDGTTPGAYVRVTRTTADALSGAATVTVSDVLNEAIGGSDLSGAEATAGESEYAAVFLKNTGDKDIKLLTIRVGVLATQATTSGGQLGSSGAGTITSAGAFADWPASGFAHIRTTAPATREIVYYSSRTNDALTVPASGRGLFGTTAAAGASTDTIDAVAPVRVATELPSGGAVQTIADGNTAPTGRTWSTGITAATGIAHGDLAAGASVGVWLHRLQVAGTSAIPLSRVRLDVGFEAT